jgi:H+/Cl- antiporter ClcA
MADKEDATVHYLRLVSQDVPLFVSMAVVIGCYGRVLIYAAKVNKVRRSNHSRLLPEPTPNVSFVTN